MRRRTLLSGIVGLGGLLAGCAGPGAEVTRPSTGEVDVTFRTVADREVDIALELVDGEGRTVDSMRSAFPPDQPGAPSFFAAGLARGPYSLTVGTGSATETVSWSVTECPRLELLVTVGTDAGLRIERTCVRTMTEPATAR